MPLTNLPRPPWLTFDCYGTLIQWDEGLRDAVARILAADPESGRQAPTPAQFLHIYDGHEHRLERERPQRAFADVSRESLRLTLEELGLAYRPEYADMLVGSISAMPPFPEVVGTLAALKQAGFRLCIISNTDDAIIAGNVAQLGGHIDRVITAEQAGAYKPRARSSPTPTPASASRLTRSCIFAPARNWITPPPAISAFVASGSTAARAARPCLTTGRTLP